MMGAASTPETSVNLYQTTQRTKQADRLLQLKASINKPRIKINKQINEGRKMETKGDIRTKNERKRAINKGVRKQEWWRSRRGSAPAAPHDYADRGCTL
jgi:hypothetical protein